MGANDAAEMLEAAKQDNVRLGKVWDSVDAYVDNLSGIADQLDNIGATMKNQGHADEKVAVFDAMAGAYRTVAADLQKLLVGEELKPFRLEGWVDPAS